MVWLLIRDTARRKWMVALFMVFQTYTVLRAFLSIWPSIDLLAWPLACSWFLNSFAGSWSTIRVITQLPISRQDVWRSRWWIVMVAGPLLVQASDGLAWWSLHSAAPHLEPVIVSIFWSCLYCGVNMALQRTRYGQTAEAPVAPGRILMTSFAVVLPVMALQFGAPLVFARFLPHTLGEFGVGSLAAAAVMGSATIWGYLYQPAVVARPSLRRPAAQARPVNSAVPQSPLDFGNRLTGIRLLLWRTARRELMTYGLLLSVAAIAALVLAPDFRKALTLGCALPFSGQSERAIEPMIYGSLLTFAGMVEILTALQLRSLRALPVSTSWLAAMPVMLGLTAAVSLWVVLLIVHLAVLGTDPLTLRLDLFLAVTGTLTAMRAVRMALPGSPVGRQFAAMFPAFAGILVTLPASEENWIATATTMAAAGASLMILSFLGTRWSIQRTQSVYRQPAIPVRM